MKKITKKLFSHQSIIDQKKYFVNDIINSKPLKVLTFRGLVKYVSQITFSNPEYSIFYRGQDKDYTSVSDASSIFPSIYRNRNRKIHIREISKSGKFISRSACAPETRKLEKAVQLLYQYYGENNYNGYARIKKFVELAWSILQHYEVCPTPLLDVTHSLRVAASFALRKNSKEGYLFLFGLPHTNGSISYYVEEEIINIKLLSTCPPNAFRPYYQEGYTIGTFPIPWEISRMYDFNRRLIAKFKLIKNDFWDKDFTPVPDDALFPDAIDEMKKVCDKIKEDINKNV